MMHRSRSALPALGLSFWGGQVGSVAFLVLQRRGGLADHKRRGAAGLCRGLGGSRIGVT